MLHVGMPKTGSSYIQGLFNKNNKKFNTINNFSCINGLTPHIIACHLIKTKNLKDRVDIKDLTKKFNENEVEKLKNTSESNKLIFMSSEYFVLCEHKDILSFFSTFFDEIEVIVTVRRQDKLISSGYNQDVKALGRTSNLTWDFNNDKLMNYFDYCERWKKINIKVHAIDYDLVKKTSNGLELEFFRLLEINKDLLNELDYPDIDTANFSLSHNEVLLKLALNRASIEDDKSILLMKSFQQYSDKREFSLPEVYKTSIASCYKESNIKFINQYLENKNSELNFSDIEFDSNHSKRINWNPLGYPGEVLIQVLKLTDNSRDDNE